MIDSQMPVQLEGTPNPIHLEETSSRIGIIARKFHQHQVISCELTLLSLFHLLIIFPMIYSLYF